jgi:asparagine synthase (glutamine-hydrolysing)
MCGLAGIISHQILKKQKINFQSLKKSLNHRGPDYSDYILDKNVFFYHSRLSIIDLNQRSHQPFYSSDQRYIIVFNGEIYNYKYLRKKLSTHYKFKTKSDTEVLLAAYITWKEKCLNLLEGAFAFCIYDRLLKKNFLARDRFGQKPLYYSKKKNSILFGSEVKSLISFGYKPKPNLDVWKNYLINGIFPEKSDSFFKDIFQVQPGQFLVVDDKLKIQKVLWYQLNKINLKKRLLKKENLLSKFKKSIKNSSESDVEYALSLSGGLDSAILTNLFKSIKNKKKPYCYSIGFGKNFNEFKNIKNTLRFNKLKGKLLNISDKECLNNIKPLIWHNEAPTGGLMQIGQTKIVNMISKKNIKVLQDGTGLDEIFGGYEIFFLQHLKNLRFKNQKLFEKHFENYLKNWNINRDQGLKKIKDMSLQNSKTPDGYDFVNKEIFTKKFLQKYKKNIVQINSVKDSMINYIQNSKIPKNSHFKDRLGLAFGVEIRFPFLEHFLVEEGLKLKENTIFQSGKGKNILRNIFKKRINSNLFKTPKIQIHTNQNQWFKKKIVQKFFLRLINNKKFHKREIYETKKVKKFYNNYLLSKNNSTSLSLWQIINTEIWFQEFIDKNPLRKKPIFKFN